MSKRDNTTYVWLFLTHQRLEYGYGAVKLFQKKKTTTGTRTYLQDFTTGVSFYPHCSRCNSKHNKI